MSVDDPIVMDANYRFSPADRRSIDNQIRALQVRADDMEDNGVGGEELLTTGATTSYIRRYPMANGQVRSIRGIITVQSTNGSGAVRGEWEFKACYARVAGTLAAEYAAVVTPVVTTGSPPNPAFALHGNTDVDLNITGIAATGLTWKLSDFTL